MCKIINKSITSLGKNSIIYGSGAIFTRFINLLLLPFFTSYLSPNDYGVLALLAILGQVMQPIFSLGLGAGMGPCYYEGNKEDTKASAVWSAFVLLLLSNCILLTVGFFLSKQFSTLLFNSADYAEFITLSICSVVLGNLKIPFTHRLQFEEKPKPFVLIYISISLSTILVNVVLVIIFGFGVKGMLIGQLFGATVGLILLLLYVSRWTRFTLRISTIRSLLRLGLPLVPSFAFLFVLLNGNKYILQWVSGLDALGIYSIGFNFGTFISLFTGGFQTAWYPFFMSFIDKPLEAKSLFGRILNYYVAIFGSLTLIFFIFSKSIVIIMTQPSFYDAYKIIGFTALAHFLLGLFSLLLPPIYFLKNVRVVSIIQGMACVPYLIIAIILIYYLGIFGAGIGLSIGLFIMVIILSLWLRLNIEYLRIPYNINRISLYALFSIPVVLTSLVDRNLDLQHEMLYIMILLIYLFLFLLFWLNHSEKKIIIKYLRIIRYNKQ